MSQREPIETTNLDTTFGSEPIPWSRPLGLLSAGPFGMDTTFVLGTIRLDGRPHAAMFGAAFYDGDMYFQTGRRTVKARNLAANPACTIAASIPGMDLVFEGEAQRGPTLRRSRRSSRSGARAAGPRRSRATG